MTGGIGISIGVNGGKPEPRSGGADIGGVGIGRPAGVELEPTSGAWDTGGVGIGRADVEVEATNETIGRGV